MEGKLPRLRKKASMDHKEDNEGRLAPMEESVASVNVAWAQLANLNMAAQRAICAHVGTVEIMGYVY